MHENQEKAKKHTDRWLHVIRSELELMEKEGIDPYIAWLSFVDTTDFWGSVDHIGDLHPSKR